MPAAERDSIANILRVAIGVSLVCSILVTGAVTLLRPIQYEKEFAFKHKYTVLQVAGIYDRTIDLDEQYLALDRRMIDISAGDYTEAYDPYTYNFETAARDKDLSIAIPEDDDEADIRRRSKFAPVTIIRDGDAIDQVILPVYGSGMWGMIYGYLAIDGDGNTVRGLRFYEHSETPGIGDQIQDPEWLSMWQGKQIADRRGRIRISVARGKVTRESRIPHEVDGISGATVTSRGVRDLIKYWVGPDGYGPYLEKLKEGEA